MATEYNGCVIGLLHHYDNSELATIDTLKEYIADSRYHNDVIVQMYASPGDKERFKRKIWTLSDYGDWRKSTNLTRFCYCPMCGKFIDWRKIRKMEDGV